MDGCMDGWLVDMAGWMDMANAHFRCRSLACENGVHKS